MKYFEEPLLKMASSNIAVSQKENNMDKSAILGYECESAQDEESETIGSKRLGNPLPACVELSVRLGSWAMLVIVNQDIVMTTIL